MISYTRDKICNRIPDIQTCWKDNGTTLIKTVKYLEVLNAGCYISFSLEADHARNFMKGPLPNSRSSWRSFLTTRPVISPAVSRQPVRVVKVIITHDKRRDSSSTCHDETKRDETYCECAVRIIFHVARNFSHRKGQLFRQHSSFKNSQ